MIEIAHSINHTDTSLLSEILELVVLTEFYQQ